MNLTKPLMLIPLGVLLGACATPHVAPGVEARAFLTPVCPLTGAPPKPEFTGLETILVGIAADVAGKAVGAGIDALAAQLKDDKSIEVNHQERAGALLRGNNAEIRLNPDAGCVVALVASFVQPVEDEKVYIDNFAHQLHLTDSAHQALANAVRKMPNRGKAILRSMDKLYVYAEYALVQTKNVENLAFDTRKYLVNDFAGEGFGVARTRDTQLNVELRTPDGKVLVAMSVAKESLKRSDLPLSSDEIKLGPWQVVDAKARVVPQNTAAEIAFLPGNIKVQYLETGKPGELSKMVGEALATKRQEAVTLAQNQAKVWLSPQEAQKSEITGINQAALIFNEYLTAYDAAATASAVYHTKNGDTPANRNNLLAKLAVADAREKLARAAFREAGLGFTANNPISGPDK